ncbi:PQQ-binding-like beta-propeller repeat protein [Halorarius litoreus]|uniref:outer membrane protein assembly factor BamB family protein n=1 Tax=Halorarius litoreus TaxID=2962676 RepID=UPI0020CF6998|nr:PQQ-binding-like beta-propeller repeat protein [Halorarius litoreus]
MPSRRSYLTALAAALAGCSAGPGTPGTDTPADPTDTPADPTDTPTGPTESPTPDGPRQLPADDPALAWAVRLPEVLEHPPAVDPDAGLVYVGGGENRITTPTPGGDAPRGSLDALDAEDGSVAWRTETDAPVVGSPVVHDGRVHVTTGRSTGYTGVDQRVRAYHAGGDRAWVTDPRGKFLEIVAAADGQLFVGTSDDALSHEGETLFAVGPDGSTAWSREAGDARAGTVEEEHLLYSDAGVGLTAYDTQAGTELWQADGEPLGNHEAPVATAGALCFTQATERNDDGYPVVARLLSTGEERWRFSTDPAGGENYVPVSVADVSTDLGTTMANPVVVTSLGGRVSYVRAGDASWTFTADADTPDGAVVGDGIYVGDETGTVYALDAGDGSVRWRASLPEPAAVQPLADGVLATTPYNEGTRTVASFRHDGTERWRYEADGTLYDPVAVGNRVYATKKDGTVLAFASDE